MQNIIYMQKSKIPLPHVKKKPRMSIYFARTTMRFLFFVSVNANWQDRILGCHNKYRDKVFLHLKIEKKILWVRHF